MTTLDRIVNAGRSGTITVTVGTDPAAGVEISQTVPDGEVWQLIAVRFSLVTSAVAGNRVPALVLDDGTNILLKANAGTTHPASITAEYNFGEFGASSSGALGASGIASVMLPRIPLPGGFRVRTITAALDAGDNYGTPVLYYIRER